uniref:Uncharacterized protein n=1 Tax=Anguilla anguilla TaxID=7936 RepID=A0A0E9U2M0_ANGAN
MVGCRTFLFCILTLLKHSGGPHSHPEGLPKAEIWISFCFCLQCVFSSSRGGSSGRSRHFGHAP